MTSACELYLLLEVLAAVRAGWGHATAHAGSEFMAVIVGVLYWQQCAGHTASVGIQEPARLLINKQHVKSACELPAGEGVCVQASTLGSLEALLEFLKSPAVKIPVSGINIGPVHKKDVMRASVMLEKGRKKFACLLAFDVPVTREAREMAESLGVRIFTADIIYHLFDQFTAYLKTVGAIAVSPVSPVVILLLDNIAGLDGSPQQVGGADKAQQG